MSAEVLTPSFGRNPIVLGEGLGLPVEVATQRVALLGMSGSGKSTAGKRLVEQLLQADQQVVIIDPKGDWSGLRTSAGGDQAGFAVPILGGNRGDAPIDPEAGERIAEETVKNRASLLLDTSFLRQAEFTRFVAAFLEALYRTKARTEHQTPLMLVVDEADLVMAQRPPKGAQALLTAAEDIVRRGRQRGLGCVMLSQRPAVLSKSCLSQVQVLLALRTVAPGDMAALRSWVECHAEPLALVSFMSSVAGLPRGEAWAWSPAWPTPEGIAQRVRISPPSTWDSGAAPMPGEVRKEPQAFAEVDAALVARLAPPPPAPTAPPPPKVPKVDIKRPLRALMGDYQKAIITARLAACGGNMMATAASLGIERSNLYKLCGRLGITRPEAPETPAS